MHMGANPLPWNLEAIGLLLPFICCPKNLIGREVTLLTDNEALVYGWDKRRVPYDTAASHPHHCSISRDFCGSQTSPPHVHSVSWTSGRFDQKHNNSTIPQRICQPSAASGNRTSPLRVASQPAGGLAPSNPLTSICTGNFFSHSY